MTDLEAVFRAIDEMSPQEIDKVHAYLQQKRGRVWWTVSPENLSKIDTLLKSVQADAQRYSEDEINATIDEAIKQGRKANTN